MPSIITRGGMSAKALGFGAGTSQAVYVEDVFSTYLYTGNGSTQTITNGIDLSTKGGLVWLKERTALGNQNHWLSDTVNGGGNPLSSNLTNGSAGPGFLAGASSFSTTGFSVGTGSSNNTSTYASWTFRRQAKFFDVVTYTGTGSARTISHALGATPGMIIVKRTDTSGNWQVYHKGLTSAAYSIQLNLTAAQASATTVWNSTAPTSSVFSVGTDATVNASGGTYVAYLFADSNSGGFGAAGTDSVVACGSFTPNASGSATVSLGWEAQWVMIKRINGAGSWRMADTMRQASLTDTAILDANTSAAEALAGLAAVYPTATGFGVNNYYASEPIIYLAIRRGPMKTPTDATKVFAPGNGSKTSGFPVDMYIQDYKPGGQTWSPLNQSRLTGSPYLVTSSTVAESNLGYYFDSNSGLSGGASPESIYWMFRRAPGFFDVVCYTGTGSASFGLEVNHGLTVPPEMIIAKLRGSTGNWFVWHKDGTQNYLYTATLNNDLAYRNYSTAVWGDTLLPLNMSSSKFTVGGTSNLNIAQNYVAYLFATCPGVSKVGSYTGTGAAQNINCGFSSSARFILIKRTDSTGDWYTYDSARGISASNDPYLLLNSTAAEVTSTNYVDAYASGFALTSSAPAGLNANGGSYIFLAVA